MSAKSVCYSQIHPLRGVSDLVNIRFIMSNFGQTTDNESFNSVAPLESLYPDLAHNTVSNATTDALNPEPSVSTRIIYWYHPDYVGNVDLVTDLNQEAYEFYLYNPWGESLYHWESGSSSWNSPYRFNSKEFDAETGMHYYGARYHHLKLSVWMSVDPLANNAPNRTPYRTFFNNPIRFTDPDGKWEVDANGNLIAEKGDNAQTLADFQGISYSQALKQMKDQGYTTTRIGEYDVLNLQVGDVVTLDNNYTQSLEDANAGKVFVMTEAEMDNLTISEYYELMEDLSDKYNCWGSCIEGSMNNDAIEPGDGIGDGDVFDAHLSSNYMDAQGNYKFGETVIRFANSKGVTHGAVFYGKNKAGEIYVYTKNGWLAYPRFMKLDDLIQQIPSYGIPTGLTSEESGYYNKNTR